MNKRDTWKTGPDLVPETSEWEQLRSSIQALEERNAELLRQKSMLEEELALRTREADDLRYIVSMMENSVPWKLANRLRAVREKLLPLGTYRRFLADRGLRLMSIAVFDGMPGLRSAWSRRKNRGRSAIEKYRRWIDENEPDQSALAAQREHANLLSYRPLISVVMPTWNPTKAVLLEAVQSLLEQTYGHWQLCIAGGGDKPEMQDMLQEFGNKDPRINLTLLSDNLGISGNSNEALKHADGDFIALLDHDDVVAPFAFFEVAKLLNEQPTLDFIYSDRDLVTANGKTRYAPLFKPDWSPELMLSANYLTHLTIIRKQLVQEVDGFRPETDEAQDWDLFLRVLEKTSRIAHIPKVLYHWRASPSSAAATIEAKPRAIERQIKIVTDHLRAKGLKAEVSLTRARVLRATWPVSAEKRISVIIPNRDRIDMLRPCVESILNKTLYKNFEVLILENGSTEGATREFYDEITHDTRVRVLKFEQDFNYSAINNFGSRHASGDVLVFLNNDTEVIDPGWLEEMLRWTEYPEIGAVGAKLLAKDGTIQHAGVILGLTGFAGHVFAGAREMHWDCFGSTEWYRNYLAVTGACLMVKAELFRKLGGFDEQFELCGSDVELCLRIHRRGLRILYTPFARLRHYEATTRGSSIPSKDFVQSLSCYKSFLENRDPFFNPNISAWHLLPEFRTREEPSPLSFAEKFVATVTAQHAQ